MTLPNTLMNRLKKELLQFLLKFNSKIHKIHKYKQSKSTIKLGEDIVIFFLLLLSLIQESSLKSALITKNVIIWVAMLYAMKVKDSQHYLQMELILEGIPDFLFLGWEVISTKIILFPIHEDYQGSHLFPSEVSITMQKM